MANVHETRQTQYLPLRCAAAVLFATGFAFAAINGGCDSMSSNSHSRGLLKDDAGRGVNNPYIVGDPAQRRTQPPATQPAQQPGSPQ